MKINIRARLNNKAFIISGATLLVSILYRLLSVYGVIPCIEQQELLDVIGMGVNMLALLGVVVDPTTEGISDSDRAMTYCTDLDERKKEVSAHFE